MLSNSARHQAWIRKLQAQDPCIVFEIEKLVREHRLTDDDLARTGVPLDLLRQARLRFARHALGALLFEGSDRHIGFLLEHYLRPGILTVEEISCAPEHQLLLRGLMNQTD